MNERPRFKDNAPTHTPVIRRLAETPILANINRVPRPALSIWAVLGMLLACISTASAQFNVLTRNYDNQRTGANLSETILNHSNVNSSQFGKLFMLPVDDQVYSGILYVSNLAIAGGTHNVIYVATSNNTVYAFDADTLTDPLWVRNFNGSGRPTHNTEVGQACGNYRDFFGNGNTGSVANIGIVGTPVIDEATWTMYLVTRTVEGTNTVQKLQAIDIRTGADRDNSPQIIQASVPGTGAGTDGANVVFNAITANQRPALALSQGIIYIGWSSFCDTGPYHGWLLGYDATSLAQLGVFNDTPNGTRGGIWQSGAAPAFDASGNLYLGTGNGSFNGTNHFGESLLKLTQTLLSPLDYFTPSSYTTLEQFDWDFGSQGPVMLPGTNLFVTGGKEGKMYLLNTNNLGHMASGDTQIPQVIPVVELSPRPGDNFTHHLHNASPIWGSPQGLNLYVWAENDFLHGYRFDPVTQKFTVDSTGTAKPFANGMILPPIGMPGGMMVVSANGSQPGTGIVWASIPRIGDANQDTVPGNLFAFNAESLALLWSSSGPGDDTLNFAKGAPPLVANGKVYLASLSGFVSVYGPKTGNQDASSTQNLALNKPATGSAPCDRTETPDKAFDGSVATKWCSSAPDPFLQVDLGANFSLNRFVLEHASAGGESPSLNTRDFTIQVSVDNVNFATVVNTTGNTYSITTHDISPITARYVRLNVLAPQTAAIYEFQVFGSPAPETADFQVSATPGSQTVVTGSSTSFTAAITGFNSFSDRVDLNVIGLPSGALAAFAPSSVTGSGTSTLAISTSSSILPGSYLLTITATSGALAHRTVVTLTVNRVSAGSVQVNSPTPYNVLAISTDGARFSGGLVGSQGGAAYSASYLGPTQLVTGISFKLGPADRMGAWRGGTVLLPSDSGFSTLGMLAMAYNGNKANRVFTITYTDGTTNSVVQSISDWFTPQNYAGESRAVLTPYRNYFDGTRDSRPFFLYAYFLPLNSSKTVESITLPSGDVVAFAFTLLKTPDFQVLASPASQTISAGGSTSFMGAVTGSNGFADVVDLSVSGLPRGASASFTPSSINGGSGDSTLDIATSSDQPGTFPLMISGSAGSLKRTAMATLNVNVVSAGSVPVSAAELYDTLAFSTDGQPFADDLGGAYSANLLGSMPSLNGIPFKLGPPDKHNSWGGRNTIPLPKGQFATLGMLAAAVGGNQPNQLFTVVYTDGTFEYFLQSISDWFTPQNYSRETKLSMAYLNLANGGRDNRTFNVYGYFLPLNPNKTVSNFTCTGGNVVLLALTLVPSRSTTPDYALSASPTSLSLTPGATTTTTITVTPLNGFSQGVHLSVSGLPPGVKASLSPSTTRTTSTLTLSANGPVPAGTFSVTINGDVSGTDNNGDGEADGHPRLTRTTGVALVVRPDASSSVPVDLSAGFLRTGFTTDFVPFSSGGLDGGGAAFSANLLRPSLIFQGVEFDFGPADAPDAVPGASQPIALPAGGFSTLKVLATGLQGMQRSQRLRVDYSDGSSASFTQDFSDWFGVSPPPVPGETRALGMAYRNIFDGGRDNRTFNLFGYSFGLNAGKTVTSVTLPNDPNVQVLAITLVP